ncbi:hypothetical protein [Streptomyces alkaliterrae]|uniref:Uncharacterized protein n=1 Tax=Streptomyces alkaliterrae TaxID=2213162 RepID=A0A5P0YXX5_9ACTN|nr:hypothetical protein [Streptomyces alkaliterrae]MBB1260839.1 hypothetical protein [Streptomyces alkaliterrae]MQS05128.1 hypothetical protein [Streptomyces alkaliterrae]
MISRRKLLGTAAGATALAALPGVLLPPTAAARSRQQWRGDRSENGWSIRPSEIRDFHISGAGGLKARLHPLAAPVLLHIARRWHYEVLPLDEGGEKVLGHTADREVGAPFESNHLSGSAIALRPAAFPLSGTEPLWPHQDTIVRDILLDCAGTVVWGGDLTPTKISHFHLAVRPGDRKLARVAAALDPATREAAPEAPPQAGAGADPATPGRRARARGLQRAQQG